ncbi:GNAT family N-acetyltransferase [Flavobacterium sp. SM15]|uniref:GNAT family N-acetyltransferase n=1 Tax=Flavobacterium sp. SM15 TaxID=2908005 RepID=UPI001EDC5DAE|nr:GNAT family N-acetyltransferase [Flavobacterium sp. SM15]MCG2611215.1 GNAT family N-acetyltransferase [Flavobacterium sp. SM15]
MIYKELQILPIKPNELEILLNLSKKTFFDAFNKQNSPENMMAYMDSAFTVEKLSSELNNPESSFYFVRHQDIPIGYLKLNFGSAQTELMQGKSIEIERIYVLEEFQGQKIGQILIEKAISIAKTNNADFIWLGVWEKNPGAIRFYQKNGFEVFSSHLFTMGTDIQTDILMRLLLV